jgi:hypothetical protein
MTQAVFTEAQARAALAKLVAAAAAFRESIRVFQSQYGCDTVGLDDWSESIADTLFELEKEISSAFEE